MVGVSTLAGPLRAQAPAQDPPSAATAPAAPATSASPSSSATPTAAPPQTGDAAQTMPPTGTAAGSTAPAGATAVTPAPEPDPRPAFADWLAGVRQEALARGIRADIVQQALGDIQEPVPVVLERDRSQAEIILPLETYVNRRLTKKNITAGRQMYGQHKALLDDIEKQYGVPGRIIVSIWGIESNYGRFSGVRPTVAALATLAWDPRRATFFRGELFNALEILNRGDIEIGNMKGSWAGAMGQPQFMPSSYLQYAADYDGDGRRDIWSSAPDVFASIANYLKGHGWTAEQRWGREVKISEAVGEQIRAGENCEHAGRGHRIPGVDPHDARQGIGGEAGQHPPAQLGLDLIAQLADRHRAVPDPECRGQDARHHLGHGIGLRRVYRVLELAELRFRRFQRRDLGRLRGHGHVRHRPDHEQPDPRVPCGHQVLPS